MAEVTVYDLATAAVVKTTSVFTSNSESVRTRNDITTLHSEKPLYDDIIYNFRRDLTRELNKISQ